MAWLSTAIQVIGAIPQILKLVKSVIAIFRGIQNDKSKAALNSGVEELKKAQTKEELQRANQSTTRNLP